MRRVIKIHKRIPTLTDDRIPIGLFIIHTHILREKIIILFKRKKNNTLKSIALTVFFFYGTLTDYRIPIG